MFVRTCYYQQTPTDLRTSNWLVAVQVGVRRSHIGRVTVGMSLIKCQSGLPTPLMPCNEIGGHITFRASAVTVVNTCMYVHACVFVHACVYMYMETN